MMLPFPISRFSLHSSLSLSLSCSLSGSSLVSLHATDVKRAKWAGPVSPLLTGESTRPAPARPDSSFIIQPAWKGRVIDRFSSAIRESSTGPLLLECARVDGRLPRGPGQELDQTDSLAPQS